MPRKTHKRYICQNVKYNGGQSYGWTEFMNGAVCPHKSSTLSFPSTRLCGFFYTLGDAAETAMRLTPIA